MRVPINLNDEVRFSLTDHGFEIYQDHRRRRGLEAATEPPPSMQLWRFMQIFGPRIRGFDSEVLTVGNDLSVEARECGGELAKLREEKAEAERKRDLLADAIAAALGEDWRGRSPVEAVRELARRYDDNERALFQAGLEGQAALGPDWRGKTTIEVVKELARREFESVRQKTISDCRDAGERASAATESDSSITDSDKPKPYRSALATIFDRAGEAGYKAIAELAGTDWKNVRSAVNIANSMAEMIAGDVKRGRPPVLLGCRSEYAAASARLVVELELAEALPKAARAACQFRRDGHDVLIDYDGTRVPLGEDADPDALVEHVLEARAQGREVLAIEAGRREPEVADKIRRRLADDDRRTPSERALSEFFAKHTPGALARDIKPENALDRPVALAGVRSRLPFRGPVHAVLHVVTERIADLDHEGANRWLDLFERMQGLDLDAEDTEA